MNLRVVQGRTKAAVDVSASAPCILRVVHMRTDPGAKVSGSAPCVLRVVQMRTFWLVVMSGYAPWICGWCETGHVQGLMCLHWHHESAGGAHADRSGGISVWLRTMNLRAVRDRTCPRSDASAFAPRILAWCIYGQIRWQKCLVPHHVFCGWCRGGRFGWWLCLVTHHECQRGAQADRCSGGCVRFRTKDSARGNVVRNQAKLTSNIRTDTT